MRRCLRELERKLLLAMGGCGNSGARILYVRSPPSLYETKDLTLCYRVLQIGPKFGL